MDQALETEVRERAKGGCEYCQMPQAAYRFTFPLDHIRAVQHRGETIGNNEALACTRG